jgi:hypothetical protein
MVKKVLHDNNNIVKENDSRRFKGLTPLFHNYVNPSGAL